MLCLNISNYLKIFKHSIFILMNKLNFASYLSNCHLIDPNAKKLSLAANPGVTAKIVSFYFYFFAQYSLK